MNQHDSMNAANDENTDLLEWISPEVSEMPLQDLTQGVAAPGTPSGDILTYS